MARRNQAKEEGDEGKSSERRSKGLENALHARDRVQCLKDEVANTSARRSASTFAFSGEENAFDLDSFKNNLRINIVSMTPEVMEFDLIGVDASFANALRRILLAEVPTVAIENVFIADNTSLIADEVLSHRLGLIPLEIDPRLLVEQNEEGFANEKNTVVFRLRAECVEHQDGSVTGDKVLSSALEWLPNGSDYAVADGDPKNRRPAHTNGMVDPDEIAAATYTAFRESQKDMFPAGVRAVHDDILIAKLTPGQRIDLEGHAVKGVGKDHAKWSPVATAHYRMLPEIVVSEEVVDELADELKEKCAVFDVKEVDGKKVPIVADPRSTSLTARVRNFINDPEWADRIEINLIKNHFVFTIESTGALKPEELFEEALEILKEKCTILLNKMS